MTKSNAHSCQCKTCKAQCKYKPGWFLPNEIESVAAYLKMSLEELFENWLCVDWYEVFADDEMFVLSPGVLYENTGTEFPSDPHGTCVFLDDDNLCTIYPVRPFECRESIHDEDYDLVMKRHREVAEAWKPHIDQIRKLLGREPVASDYEISWADRCGF